MQKDVNKMRKENNSHENGKEGRERKVKAAKKGGRKMSWSAKKITTI